MLGVTLSRGARARAVQLPAWNEALGLPRPWDQQWSLRLQQVLAYESDLLEYPDLFDGSPVVEAARLCSAAIPGQILATRTVRRVIGRGGDHAFEAFYTFTRQPPVGWTGYRRRIDAAMLAEVMKPFAGRARVYVCGPTLLVEAVANSLVQMELPIEQIRTERFGPTGP